MPGDSSDEYLEPYREAVRAHGASFQATLWGTEEAQRLRFDVMIELAGFEECVIVDLGCGRGDFAARLLEKGVTYRRYVGIDALAEQVELAATRGFPRCEFRAGDALADDRLFNDIEPDFITISGTLNTMDDETARTLVQRAYERAAQGVIFNFLSDRPHARWQGRDLTPARRFDTVGWLAWAMSRTSRATFTQDYLDGHDATIMMRHDGE